MTKTVEYNSWPLPESLTWKVVSYMNAYRVVVSILLGIAHFGWLAAAAYTFGLPRVVANALLIGYMVFAAFHLFSARNKAANVRFLATYSLFADILFLSLLSFIYGGVGGGLGLLLVFTSAVAAVLLPLRMAMGLQKPRKQILGGCLQPVVGKQNPEIRYGDGRYEHLGAIDCPVAQPDGNKPAAKGGNGLGKMANGGDSSLQTKIVLLFICGSQTFIQHRGI